MIKEQYTGQGKVLLLAGGGKIYTDIAARNSTQARERSCCSQAAARFIRI